ncbi:MAG: tetratricopeptide repeat protein, partial [Phycisphaerae bacterium]
KNIPPGESAFHAAAIEALAAAISEAGGTAAGDLLRRYRERLAGKPATRPASRPAVVKPTVKPDPHRREGRRETDPRLAQVSRWIDAGQTDRAAKLIAAVLQAEPAERLAPWYYRQGRCLEVAAKNDEDRLRAALAYMRVPVHYPADPLCAECLYRAAMIHIRTGHADRATGLLREALRHSPSADLKAQCEQALQEGRR